MEVWYGAGAAAGAMYGGGGDEGRSGIPEVLQTVEWCWKRRRSRRRRRRKGAGCSSSSSTRGEAAP